jgi:hypothetical protein
VLITDGLIADDAAAIERAAATGLTIHTIAIGAAPNRWLLAAIAARTGGVARAAVTIDEGRRRGRRGWWRPSRQSPGHGRLADAPR